MIKLINISKDYIRKSIKKPALNDISLEFKENNFYSITGKSGSGKSTLLNIISMLEFPTKGKMIIDNEEINFSNTKYCDDFRRSNFSLVYEESNMFNKETLKRNLEISCACAGVAYDENRVIYLMSQLELKFDLLEQKISHVSGGELTRCCILRALLLNKRFIILDEPTAGLDYDSSRKVFETLNAIKKDKIIIISTHDTKFAKIYSDEIISLKSGQLIATERNNKAPKNTLNIDNKNCSQKVKKPYKIFCSLFKSNVFLYFLVFIFCVLFCNGLDLSLSITQTNMNASNMQESINKIENGYFAEVTYDKDNHDLVKKELDEIIGNNNYLDIYQNNNLDKFIGTSKANIDYQDFFEIEGDMPSNDNEIALSRSGYDIYINSNYNKALSDTIGKEYTFHFSDAYNKDIYNLKVTGIITPKFESEHLWFALNEKVFSELVNSQTANLNAYKYKFSLKGDNFKNIAEKLTYDSGGLISENILYIVYSDDNSLLSYYFDTYRYQKDGLLILSVSEIIVSIIFIYLIFYIILSKNKDSILMYRTLGIRKKDSFKMHAIITACISLLGCIASIPLTIYFLNLFGTMSTRNNPYGLLFYLYSYKGWVSIVTFIAIILISCLYIYFSLSKIYKTKKLSKL